MIPIIVIEILYRHIVIRVEIDPNGILHLNEIQEIEKIFEIIFRIIDLLLRPRRNHSRSAKASINNRFINSIQPNTSDHSQNTSDTSQKIIVTNLKLICIQQ